MMGEVQVLPLHRPLPPRVVRSPVRPHIESALIARLERGGLGSIRLKFIKACRGSSEEATTNSCLHSLPCPP